MDSKSSLVFSVLTPGSALTLGSALTPLLPVSASLISCTFMFLAQMGSLTSGALLDHGLIVVVTLVIGLGLGSLLPCTLIVSNISYSMCNKQQV